MNETKSKKGNKKELLDYLLNEVEFIDTPKKGRRKQRNKRNEKEQKDITTVELPVFEKLHPLTKKLIRMGIIKMQDIEEVKRIEKEAKGIKEPGEEHFKFLSRSEELETLRGLIERMILRAVEEKKRGLRIPYYVFRHLEPEPTYRDVERIAKEIAMELRGVRADFEDGFLNVFVVSDTILTGGVEIGAD